MNHGMFAKNLARKSRRSTQEVHSEEPSDSRTGWKGKRAFWRRGWASIMMAGPLFAATALFAGTPAQASVTPCGTSPYSSTGSYKVYCYAPSVTVLQSNTSACPGSTQWYTTTDYNGVPIGWTYTNGSQQACVEVNYYPSSSLASDCSWDFYVPNKDATGTIMFYDDNGNGTPANPTLNENPVSGWQSIFVSPGTFWVSFLDANGQPVGAYQLGWGNNAQYGLMAICPT